MLDAPWYVRQFSEAVTPHIVKRKEEVCLNPPEQRPRRIEERCAGEAFKPKSAVNLPDNLHVAASLSFEIFARRFESLPAHRLECREPRGNAGRDLVEGFDLAVYLAPPFGEGGFFLFRVAEGPTGEPRIEAERDSHAVIDERRRSPSMHDLMSEQGTSTGDQRHGVVSRRKLGEACVSLLELRCREQLI